MYQTGDTIRATIEAIQKHQYVLPAIQREFVWKPEQIAKLFDSLMQGYPVGTLLLWRVDADSAGKYRFYDFVRDYHERDHPHCPGLPAQHSALTAVLDGQQRLTALTIGLTGSMATKLKNKWWKNPDAFPKRFLYLDLLSGKEADEDGSLFRFEFLSENQAGSVPLERECWFKVSEVLTFEKLSKVFTFVNADSQLDQEQRELAVENLSRLFEIVNTEKVIAYYEEKSQELSRVLNIFIRMNSGGTVLSYSDLLLSIAVAQWKSLDAREEIHSLVDEVNKTGDGFQFSQDLVLKAGLVLTDIGNVGFKVENFDEANMGVLEARWDEVRRALHLTVRLFASFGYNVQNLRAASVLLPVAYYLCQKDPGEKYLTTAAYVEDRQAIRTWVAKSLLKSSGIWGSGLDTLLTYLRETIREHGKYHFPRQALEAQMAKRGKSLNFEREEIEELLDMEYGKAQTFSLLSLLFPFVDFQQSHHLDHIFPKSGFRKQRLRKVGLSEDEIERCRDRRDRVANLQLLEGHANIEKQDLVPGDWLASMFSSEEERISYLHRYLLPDLMSSWSEFGEFYEIRRKLLRQRLAQILGVELPDSPVDEA